MTQYAITMSEALGGSGVLVINIMNDDIEIPQPGDYYLEFRGTISYLLQTAGVSAIIGTYKGLFDIQLHAGIQGGYSQYLIIKDQYEDYNLNGYIKQVTLESIMTVLNRLKLYKAGTNISTGVEVIQAFNSIKDALPDEYAITEPFIIKVPFSTTAPVETWTFEIISKTISSALGLSTMFSNIGIDCKLDSITLIPR